MITRETKILPQPASIYQLLLDAATAWPAGIATQWIPDPAVPAGPGGADPGLVRDAVAGFALTIRCGTPPACQTAAK